MAYQTYFYTKILSVSVWGWCVRECFCLCVSVNVGICLQTWCKKILKNAKNLEKKYVDVTKNYWNQEFPEKISCLYVYLFEYICMWVCEWACMYVWVWVFSVSICLCVWVFSVSICLCVYLYLCVCVCVLVCVCVCLCLCVCVWEIVKVSRMRSPPRGLDIHWNRLKKWNKVSLFGLEFENVLHKYNTSASPMFKKQ